MTPTTRKALEAAREGLAGAMLDMKHARIFISTREVMHPDGRALFEETLKLVESAYTTVRAELEKEQSNG